MTAPEVTDIARAIAGFFPSECRASLIQRMLDECVIEPGIAAYDAVAVGVPAEDDLW